jgi:hypothetical protein
MITVHFSGLDISVSSSVAEELELFNGQIIHSETMVYLISEMEKIHKKERNVHTKK